MKPLHDVLLKTIAWLINYEKLSAIVWTQLSNMWLSTLEIDEAQLRSVIEIAPPQSSCVWTEVLSVMNFVVDYE